MLKRLLVLVCALSATVLAATASVAVAQDDEVFVDPDSPSGKEYALPVDRERRKAARSSKATRSRAAPLFGEGVDGRGGSRGTAATSTQSREAPDAANSDGPRQAGTERRAPRAAATRKTNAAAQSHAESVAAEAAAREAKLARAQSLRSQAATPDGGMGLGGIIAAGLGVLVIGGLIGLWLRRRGTA